MTSIVRGSDPGRTAVPDPAPATTGRGHRWHGWALAGICALAGLLYLWAIGSSDYGNAYYSAAVRSMLVSPGNFLFGAADPYGVIATDKPPLALWPQAVSTMVFGYHSWAILVPQAIEGIAAVYLLHRTVRRWAGERAALIAALVFALTPITVAINRGNNPDTMMVLLLVASAYAFTRSITTEERRGRTRWLLLCAFFVGCAFLAKWLEAWIVAPGLAVTYLVCTTDPIRRRVADVVKAGAVLLVTSFWWPVLHDLWPGGKPRMDAGTDGSALQLIFGYNGIGRLFDIGQEYGGAGLNVALAQVGMGGGDPDITRMGQPVVGDQISWLLPLCLVVLALVSATGYRRLWHHLPGDRRQRAGWLLWGGWLVVTVLVFSFAQGLWHPYYTTMLAPAMAAVAGAGVPLLWRKYREDTGYGWTLLPVAAGLTALWAFELISRQGAAWNGWSRWVVLTAGAVAVAGLALGRGPSAHRAVGGLAAAAGLLAMLLGPAVWSAGTAIVHGTNGGFPSAGPTNVRLNTLVAGGFGGADLSPSNRRILQYAVEHADGAAITLAVEGGSLASSSFVVGSTATVVGLGGYLGADDAPSVDQLHQWVEQGKLKFVLSARPGGPRMGGIAGAGGQAMHQRMAWTQRACALVDPAAYGGGLALPDNRLTPMPGFGDAVLYTCRP